MKPRKLTASEVTFTIELEPEDTEVRGNVVASDDDAIDKQCEDEILERLDRGDIEAWCCVKVTASWNGYHASESLGCCSFSGDYTPEVCINEYGLKHEALGSLNANIELAYAKLAPLLDTDPGDDTTPDSEATQKADHDLDESKHYWR
jgi:hypothetical protein